MNFLLKISKNIIITLWEDRYNKFYKLSEIDVEYDTAILYLVYKTIKVAQYEETFNHSKSLSFYK